MSRGLGRESGGYGQVAFVLWCLSSERVGWRGGARWILVDFGSCWVLLEDARSWVMA